MRYATLLLTVLTTLTILAGCKASIEVPPRSGSYDYENEPNDTDYYADYIPGFPFYGVDGHCGSRGDNIDKFYFVLQRSGTVRISMAIDDYRNGDLDLALEDDRYELDSSEGYGRYEDIELWLPPGTYYISVFSQASDWGSGYVLSGEFYRGARSAETGSEEQETDRSMLPLKRTDYSQTTKVPADMS